jgi:hypothetical protein
MTKKTISVAISRKAYAILKDKAHHERRSVNIWLDYYLEKTFPMEWRQTQDNIAVKDSKLQAVLKDWED